ncbi:MAG: hypothetical protein ACI89L_001184 [Phycisphaerales bacterium]|jgi:hypothetical protein
MSAADALPPAQPRREYCAARAQTPPIIDGDLTKSAWARAPWTEDFVDIEGDLKPRPAWRTRAKMLWDDECFYFAAQMEEPRLWATLTERDSVIWKDNDFEVFLDPSMEASNYYELEINALGTEFDLCIPRPYREGATADHAWRIEGLGTAVNLDGELNNPSAPVPPGLGWSVEIAMPWGAFDRHTSTPRAPKLGDRWRVNFSRVNWDLREKESKAGGERAVWEKVPEVPEHNWVWSPMGLIDMHLPLRWGEVVFGA